MYWLVLFAMHCLVFIRGCDIDPRVMTEVDADADADAQTCSTTICPLPNHNPNHPLPQKRTFAATPILPTIHQLNLILSAGASATTSATTTTYHNQIHMTYYNDMTPSYPRIYERL